VESRTDLQRAIKANVTILTGSDNYINFRNATGRSCEEYPSGFTKRKEMSPLQILRSSTYLSAKFMNMEDKIGVLKKDAYADIIAVKGDIEKDFSKTIFNIVFVMKDGEIYVDKH